MQPLIPNTVFRKKARAALKPMMPVVVLCALIANLPSLAAQTVSILSGSNPMTYLLSAASTDEELLALLSSNEAIFAAFSGFLTPSRIASLALSVVSFLVSPVLMMGLTNSLLMLLRGQEIEVRTVFSRMSIFLKSIGLNLLTLLKVILWSCPGGLLMVAGGIAALLTGWTWLFSLYFAGMVLMMVQMIRAMLHYAMSTIYMADDPTLGVRASLKKSIGMMRSRKMPLLSLTISVYVWLFVVSILESIVSSMFGTVIGSTVSMALQLVISVYLCTCQCAFYEAYREPRLA